MQPETSAEPHPLEAEFLNETTERIEMTYPWNERCWSFAHFFSEDMPKREFTPDMLLSIVRSIQGQTVVGVYRKKQEKEERIHILLEPAYIEQDQVAKARWKWWEWLRRLKAKEEGLSYLKHYGFEQ